MRIDKTINNLKYLKAVLSNQDITVKDSKHRIHNIFWRFKEFDTEQFGKFVVLEQNIVAEDKDVMKELYLRPRTVGVLKLQKDKNGYFFTDEEIGKILRAKGVDVLEWLKQFGDSFYGAKDITDFALTEAQLSIARVILDQPKLDSDYKLDFQKMQRVLNEFDWDYSKFENGSQFKNRKWIVGPVDRQRNRITMQGILVTEEEYFKMNQPYQDAMPNIKKDEMIDVFFNRTKNGELVRKHEFDDLFREAMFLIYPYLAPEHIREFHLDLDQFD